MRIFGPDEQDKPLCRVVLLFACHHDNMYLLTELKKMQDIFPHEFCVITTPRIDKLLVERICQQEKLNLNVNLNHNNDDGNDDGSDDSVKVFVCGPPSFYKDFCGPRQEEAVTGILQELGFSSRNVIKF